MDDKLITPKTLEVEQLVSINEKLGKLIELNVDGRDSLKLICKYKEEQKQGDIRYRKKSNTQSIVGILIAMVAVYISIKGYDGSFLALIGRG